MQQAAYGLLNETQREQIHTELGQRLLERLTDEEIETHLFEVTDQLARAGRTAMGLLGCTTLVNLDTRAGHKAMTATAYVSALEDFERALSRLTEDSWASDYRSVLNLYTAAAEAAFLSGSYEHMKLHCRAVHEHATCVSDRIPVFISEIRSRTSRGNAHEAVRLGLRILAELGLNIPEAPTAEQTTQAFTMALERLFGVKIATLESQPFATDSALLAKI